MRSAHSRVSVAGRCKCSAEERIVVWNSVDSGLSSASSLSVCANRVAIEELMREDDGHTNEVSDVSEVMSVDLNFDVPLTSMIGSR